MMINSPIKLGGVYSGPWSDDPVRVLAFDSEVVMYDIWFASKNNWGLAKLNRAVSYYKISHEIFLSQFSYIRTDELTQIELDIHRPDLPFSFAQYSEIDWYDNVPKTIEEISEILTLISKKRDSDCVEVCLDVPELYLVPFGPKDGYKPGMLIAAQNGKAFTQAELLWNAWNLQKPYLRDVHLTTGVGLYRSGLQKKIPSYYIWGAKSRFA